MRAALLILVIAAIASASEPDEAKFDAVIDRFILADTGRLTGVEAKKAIAEFDKLGIEAVPSLIRGLHKSAKIAHSCPVLMISKKLSKLLLASDDEKLVEMARDEIGAGLSKSPHARILVDLRVRLAIHQNALARRSPIPPQGPKSMTTSALMKAIPKARGEQLHAVLRELGTRDEPEALTGLSFAAARLGADSAKLAREMLDLRLSRETVSRLLKHVEEGNVEVKRSAIRVSAEKHVEMTLAIIDRLTDDNPTVRAEARAALRKRAEDKVDFGPEPTASPAQQREAQQRWRAWWLEQTK